MFMNQKKHDEDLNLQDVIADQANKFDSLEGVEGEIGKLNSEINQKIQKCLVQNKVKIWKPDKVEFTKSTLNYLKKRDPDFGKEIM